MYIKLIPHLLVGRFCFIGKKLKNIYTKS